MNMNITVCQRYIRELIFLPILTMNLVAFAMDCEKSSSVTERKICSFSWQETGYTLQDLDTQLNLIYRAALERVPDRDKLRTEQREWLKVRDKCNEAKCFNDIYDARIRVLAVIPGKSGANNINFFESNPTQLSKLNESAAFGYRVTSLLTRSGGLRYFDGGVNDFDIVGVAPTVEKEGLDTNTCSYYLFGTGVAFSSACQSPNATNGMKLNMTPFPVDWRGGRGDDAEFLENRTITATGIELEVVKGHNLLTESSGSRCEPFVSFLKARTSGADTVLWQWAYFYVTTEERICRFSNTKSAPLLKYPDSVHHVGSALLPGGDLLAGSARLDPQTGLPRDRSRVAAISQQQALQVKRKLLTEYFSANPSCKGAPESCPDPSGPVRYMWQQLAHEIKPYYVSSK